MLKVYRERASMRAIQRFLGVSRPTLARWLKKSRAGALGGANPLPSRGERCGQKGREALALGG
ncbi:helix-turn-helix domain-containing protein, partial [Thermoflexus sp.]|uniref:helix-turn-helix domain-containing protein n=1 Tax=Thermoflexus sp. TaxID=1969742 RepID=UPI0035E45885